jgi:cytochrome c oxidase subunit II
MEEGTEETKAPASERLRTADHKAPIMPLVAIGVIASALGIALGLIIDWFPVAASEQVDQVDHFYDVLIIASVPMFVLVTTVVLYCVYRFKMRPGEEDMDGPPIHGNTRLEVIWTVIPAVMMLGLCIYAAIRLGEAEKAPAASEPEEITVRVVGEQFTWTFFYENEQGEEIPSNQLYLPVDRSVNFEVQTKDVLHDFWVPAFRWKIDAVPGLTTQYRVTPNRIGRYPVVCAELCGLGHATMRQTATVMDPEDWETWLSEQNEAGTTAAANQEGEDAGGSTDEGEDSGAADGEAVFSANGCGGCHVLAAAGTSGQTGPDLDEALQGQDDAMIEESITDPNKEISPGYGENIMPNTYGSLPQEELDALVNYLVESTK